MQILRACIWMYILINKKILALFPLSGIVYSLSVMGQSAYPKDRLLYATTKGFIGKFFVVLSTNNIS